jgi:hypothetical protein
MGAQLDVHPSDDDPSDEVAFWRGFIAWWAREKDEPIPARAWAALTHAEQKHQQE